MFWWLYYTEHPAKNFTQVPLVLWLQGGPGASSCGFGNFEEIGPRDTKLNPRNSSWAQLVSLLFVDNPVGTGYSYTTERGAFAKDVDTVASDMLVLLRAFFSSKPEFQKTPFYIFSESYGGKMAAAIALALHQAITAGRIRCTLGGVALGDSWISPIDSVLSWGPYLYSMSLLDDSGLKEVQTAAIAVQEALAKGQSTLATELWSKTEDIIEQNTDGVNFYNILTKESLMSWSAGRNMPKFNSPYLGRLFRRHVLPLNTDDLDELMNGPIRTKLKIIPDSVRWGGQAALVFENMAGDFMKPVVNVVDKLLSAGVNVTVYNGQLDLIVDTVGRYLCYGDVCQVVDTVGRYLCYGGVSVRWWTSLWTQWVGTCAMETSVRWWTSLWTQWVGTCAMEASVRWWTQWVGTCAMETSVRWWTQWVGTCAMEASVRWWTQWVGTCAMEASVRWWTQWVGTCAMETSVRWWTQWVGTCAMETSVRRWTQWVGTCAMETS
ncbi:retinoid-inducible serine carboxypeptidase, partial [Engystomops pustulosus]|uniref:retinoid-inducible serine carboxypeptidase n=1 Tax=Engystomops pustulosus TaxID=76066 RepID=UPI003AFB6007